jgi:hypothetical protein
VSLKVIEEALVVGVGWRCQANPGGRDGRDDGEQLHVSMLRVTFGPWQRIRVNSQRDV